MEGDPKLNKLFTTYIIEKFLEPLESELIFAKMAEGPRRKPTLRDRLRWKRQHLADTWRFWRTGGCPYCDDL
jgi:hypothetical protein